MTNAELDALAKGLSDAEKAWMLDPVRLDSESSQIAAADPEWDECARLGLADYWTDQLTPLGLALRNHLRAQEGSAGGGV